MFPTQLVRSVEMFPLQTELVLTGQMCQWSKILSQSQGNFITLAEVW